MNYTDHEITASYRAAKDRQQQVKILSQMNDCNPREIVEILLRNGFPSTEFPKRYRPGGSGGGKPEKRGHAKGWKPPRPKRDPETGKTICGQCGGLFDGNKNQAFCSTCIVKRREAQIRERVQRDRERREAEYAANPKRCADCGEVLENRLATYCKPCAATREKEAARRANKRSYFKRKNRR